MQNKNVGVVCATYRDPDKASLVRLYGIVSLIDQMRRQDYGGAIKIAIVDSSATPHPFLKEIEDKFSDSLLYLHMPSRNGAGSAIGKDYPAAARFTPGDDVLAAAYRRDLAERVRDGKGIVRAETKLAAGDFELSPAEWNQIVGKEKADLISPGEADRFRSAEAAPDDGLVDFWLARLREMRAAARLIPFERNYPIQTNIFSQVFTARPTIGMKKNAGVQALAEKFGAYDAIVFADDDDHHGPDYVARSVAALGDRDFTRMTRYLTHVFNRGGPRDGWGIFDLEIERDANGYWQLTPEAEEHPFHRLRPDGDVMHMRIGDKFTPTTVVAWPILCHEGALHTYSFKAWQASVDKAGGAVPVSFCEDILFYRRLKDVFGEAFRDVQTPVAPGTESFVRIADGTNASVIEWMEDLPAAAVPAWAHSALAPLYAAAALPAGTGSGAHADILRRLGVSYARTGALALSEITALPAAGPAPFAGTGPAETSLAL